MDWPAATERAGVVDQNIGRPKSLDARGEAGGPGGFASNIQNIEEHRLAVLGEQRRELRPGLLDISRQHLGALSDEEPR